MQYFSLLASLPSIRLYDVPEMTTDAFFRTCDGIVPEQKLRLLRSLSLVPGRSNDESVRQYPAGSVADRYMRWETALRWSILKLRAAKTGADFASFGLPEYDSEADRMAVQAYGAGNPLERERLLDHARWVKLDELTQSLLHPYRFDGLCAYLLKLQIAWKWAKRKADGARENLDRAALSVQEQQQTSDQTTMEK